MNNIRISIVSPSIRPKGLEIVASAVSKQSFRGFEWLVGTPFVPKLNTDNIPNFKWVEDNFKDGVWSLNRIYNKMFKEAKGEIIVSLQDWVWVPPDGLQKFVDAMESISEGIISGVGDQYEKMGDFKPEVKIWSDPRKTIEHGTFYEINPSDIEFNWCAFTKDAILKVGGFCERLDFTGYGMDGYQVCERWDALGYKFYIDQSNESFTIRHDRSSFGGEENWNKNNNMTNGQYEAVRKEFMKKGQWPVLSYLK